MTRDELLKLAREAGFECFEWGGSEHVVFTGCEGPVTDMLERFASLVESRAADEDDLAWVEDYVRQQTEKQAWRGCAGGIDGSGFGVDATIATVERPTNEI